MPFAYFLLKVTACSGILFLYYLIFLKNKRMHVWNRFYLILLFLISAILPLIHIYIPRQVNEHVPEKGVQILKAVNSANQFFEEPMNAVQSDGLNGDLLMYSYILISALLLISFLYSLLKVLIIFKSGKFQRVDGTKLIFTTNSKAPFSFLSTIFWNEQIDMETETGRQVFLHELAHIRQKHTLDKLCMELVLIPFWINPFFWLARKELKMVHEFLADESAVGQGQASSFAAMILQAVYPQQFNALINPFFQSPIKRRIMMLSKNPLVKMTHLRKLMVLPLLSIILFAFTLKTKYVLTASKKDITVVIDAGHGYRPDGKPSGAQSGILHEDDIVLSISNMIMESNKDPHIHIIQSRNTQENIDLKKRVAIANENKADLFISLHSNVYVWNILESKYKQEHKYSGFEIYVSSKKPSYQKESELLGSILQQELSSVYTTKSNLLKPSTGVYVLDHNICPSVLIDCGYLSNETDAKFISDGNNQKAIAEKILNAIALYANNKESIQ